MSRALAEIKRRLQKTVSQFMKPILLAAGRGGRNEGAVLSQASQILGHLRSPKDSSSPPWEMAQQDSPLVMGRRGSEWGRSFLCAASRSAATMAAFANLSF